MCKQIYRLILILYPRSFKSQFGEESLLLFSERWRDERGFLLKVRLCLDILFDTLSSVIREHAREDDLTGLVRHVAVSAGPSFAQLVDDGPSPTALCSGALASAVALLFFSTLLLPTQGSPRGFQHAGMGGLGSWLLRVSHERQSPLRFEAASVKPVAPGGGGPSITVSAGGRFTANNVSLKRLIRWTFRVQDFQIEDGPAWIDLDKYQIDATAGRQVTNEEVVEMVRSLLQDRFKLSLQHRSKEIPAYALQLTSADLKAERLNDATQGPSRVSMKPCESELSFPPGGTVSQLANFLSGQSWINHPVVDRTGLDGVYAIKLHWTPDGPMSLVDGGFERGMPPPPPRPPSSADSPCPPGLNLASALQEQLGLKMTIAKLPVDVLGVVHAEKANPN